jgi:hypothetical protein
LGTQFFSDKHLVELYLDAPRRDGVKGRGTQGLAGPQAEASVMQGAADGIFNDQSIGKRAVIVSARRPDGKVILSTSY